MSIITKDKDFYKKMFALAIPIALQNIVNVAVSLADTIMGGLLGEIPLASANLANKFGIIYMLILFGLGSGSNVLIAQYWGKKDVKSIKSVITIMYRILFVAGSLFSVIAIFFPQWGMSLFTKDIAVQKLGAEYLRIIGFSYLISGFVTTTLTVHRAVGQVKHSMVIYTVSLLVNFAVDCTLIFGLFGAPKLGIVGAAIGTLVGRILELVMTLFYLSKYENNIKYRVSDLFKRVSGFIAKYVRAASPVLMNEIIWGMASTTVAIIIGRMSTAFVAAEGISNVVTQLVTVFIWGVAHGSGTIIGNTIGENKKEKAKEYGNTSLMISIGLGIMASIVVLIIRDPLISVFNITEEGKLYAAQLINVQAVVVIAQAVAAVCLIGVLRGAGNSRFVLFADIIFLWLISIPLGYILGIKLGFPVVTVYAVLRSDEVFKAIVAILKLKKGDWVNDLTSSEEVDLLPPL